MDGAKIQRRSLTTIISSPSHKSRPRPGFHVLFIMIVTHFPLPNFPPSSINPCGVEMKPKRYKAYPPTHSYFKQLHLVILLLNRGRIGEKSLNDDCRSIPRVANPITKAKGGMWMQNSLENDCVEVPILQLFMVEGFCEVLNQLEEGLYAKLHGRGALFVLNFSSRAK